MPEDNKKKIMASRWTVISYALFGLLFVGSGIGMKLYLGSWGLAVSVAIIVFVVVWSAFLYHLVRHPIIAFNEDRIEIPGFILSSNRKISFRDIQSVQKAFDHEAEILLTGGKRIHLTISHMKNSDYEYVMAEIKKIIQENHDLSLRSVS